MNRIVLIALSVSLLMLGLVLVSTVLSSNMFGQAQAKPFTISPGDPPPVILDVVILQCSLSQGSAIVVAASDSSDNAPAVATGKGTSCAQALSDVLSFDDRRFVLEDVQDLGFDRGRTQYTIVEPLHK